MPDPVDPPPALDALLRAADLLVRYAPAALRAVRDGEPVEDVRDAFQRLGALQRVAQDEIAAIRAQLAHQVAVAEGLSLAKLGTRLGVSKARADQLVKAATTPQEGS